MDDVVVGDGGTGVTVRVGTAVAVVGGVGVTRAVAGGAVDVGVGRGALSSSPHAATSSTSPHRKTSRRMERTP
jgi:hypothetical protein